MLLLSSDASAIPHVSKHHCVLLLWWLHISVQLRIKTDASQFELKEEGHSIVQQKREGLSCTPQVEDNAVDKLSPVLQEEEGFKDHMISEGDDVAMEPAESGCGWN